MPVHGRYTKIWVDEFDFSGDSMGLDTAVESPSIDVTPFQATGKEWLNGWPGIEIAQSGYINAAANGELEHAIFARLGAVGTTHRVAALYGTDVAACPAYVLPNAFSREMQIQAPVAGVLTINVVWNPGSGVSGGVRGYRILDATISGIGAQAGVDFGAAGAAGGFAFLWVRSISGTATNATIDIESDSDPGFGTAVSEGTLTFSAIGSYTLTMSGAIGRYIRANITSLGGSTNFAVGIIVAVSGRTY